jgi:hypothetical protein
MKVGACRVLAVTTLTLAVASVAAGQELPGSPSAAELIALVPIVSSENEKHRSFAFDVLICTDGASGMRTRCWYSRPRHKSMMIIDEADNTPLLYASGGQGVVYDALAGRCLPFTYGSMCYFVGMKDEKSLLMLGGFGTDPGGGRFDIDLQSLFRPKSTTVEALGLGAYRLTDSGQETRSSICLAPKEAVFWGQCTLSSLKSKPGDPPWTVVELVDVNREIDEQRLAFPALQPSAAKLGLTPFPRDDPELNRLWQLWLDGFKQNAPAEQQAKVKELDTLEMETTLLPQMLVLRSHFVRMGLRNPMMRGKAGKEGDNPLLPQNLKIDWDAVAARDKTIAAALRELLKEQMPLREPPPSAASQAEAQKLFQKMEQKLAAARGYQVDFESDVTTTMSMGKVKGTLLLAPGNRMKCTWQFNAPDDVKLQPEPSISVISDGKTFAVHNGRDAMCNKVEPVNDQHQDTVSGWGFRTSLFYTIMGRVNHGRDEVTAR